MVPPNISSNGQQISRRFRDCLMNCFCLFLFINELFNEYVKRFINEFINEYVKDCLMNLLKNI